MQAELATALKVRARHISRSVLPVCVVPLQDSVIVSTRNGGAELSRGLQQWPDFT
jgi:hypothetical protein